jgi:hypothetical protein
MSVTVNPLHLPPKRWYQLSGRAGRLSVEDTAFLSRVANLPATLVFERFAGARDADILGARYTFPTPSGQRTPFFEQKGVRYGCIEHAFAAMYAKAALAQHHGRTAQADSVLRVAVNAAVTLYDESGSSLDAAVGSVFVRRSLEALLALYDHAGDTARAKKLRAEYEAAEHAALLPAPFPDAPSTEQLFEGMPALFERTDIPLGVKWEYLAHLQIASYVQWCATGQAPTQSRTWRVAVEEHLNRRESYHRMFDWILQLPQDRSVCETAGPTAGGRG